MVEPPDLLYGVLLNDVDDEALERSDSFGGWTLKRAPLDAMVRCAMNSGSTTRLSGQILRLTSAKSSRVDRDFTFLQLTIPRSGDMAC